MQFIQVGDKELEITNQNKMAAKSLKELDFLNQNLMKLRSKIDSTFNDPKKTQLNLKKNKLNMINMNELLGEEG